MKREGGGKQEFEETEDEKLWVKMIEREEEEGGEEEALCVGLRGWGCVKWGRGGGGEGVLAACLIAGSELRDRQRALRKTRGDFCLLSACHGGKHETTGTVSCAT